MSESFESLLNGELQYHHLSYTEAIGKEDHEMLQLKDREYGASWKKRGGIGLFMMLARKWDRLEMQAEAHGFDVFKAWDADDRPEGILDDIGDLRRYLMLVEAQIRFERHLRQEKANKVVMPGN